MDNNFYEALTEGLKGFDVRSIGRCGNVYSVVIGSCGRKLDKTRTFTGVSVPLLVIRIASNFK
jgi:hypothetical protein